MRRLPVFLVLDTSYSMTGAPLEAINEGQHALVEALRQDPFALETVYISIIEFSSEARQTTPLTDLMQFSPAPLQANGATALGSALQVTAEAIATDVQSASATTKGDWRPLVFVFTDGRPTDDPRTGIKAIQQAKAGTIIGCAAGPQADRNTLAEFSDHVVVLETLDKDAIHAFFKWVSASVSMTSHSIESGNDGGGAELPPAPDEIQVINLNKD